MQVEADVAVVGNGPLLAAATTTLCVVPEVIHDVNGYYRDLGVDPRATRKELRLAYTAAGGPDSPRLTYVFRQLLDPEVRRAYDLTPLGEQFYDRYVHEAMWARVARLHAQRLAGLAAQGLDVTSEAAQDAAERDVLHDLGLAGSGHSFTEKPERHSGDSLDFDPVAGQNQHQFGYAYYLWAISRARVSQGTLSFLMDWQSAVARALRTTAHPEPFAVGLHDTGSRVVTGAISGHHVFFVAPDEEDLDAAARQAVASITSRRKMLP